MDHLLVYVAWFSLVVLVAADVLARRKDPVEADAAPPPPWRWSVPTLAGLATLLALIRIPLALTRSSRNVDEVQYAATAAFVRDTGQSLFGWGWNLHGHQALYLLGSWESPYTLVDVVTCLVVGATAFLVGLTVLRARGGRAAALLTVPFYVLALLRFEGLGSNKELYVNLFLAGYLLVRFGFTDRRLLRQVLAGACLGAAVVMKEQAGLFVLAEPLVEVLARLRSEGDRRERIVAFLKHQALAALGFLLPVGVFLLGFVAQGTLGAYWEFMTNWAGAGGHGLPTFAPAPPFTLPAEDAPGALTVLLSGVFALWLSTVGLLGVAHALRLFGEPRRLAERALPAGLAILALTGTVAVSIGMRWSGHYWMLVILPLAPLAALRAIELNRELRQPSKRVIAGVLALLVAIVLVLEALFLLNPIGQSAARGGGLEGEERARVEQVAEWVERSTPADATILVFGWRPELYFASNRKPATRFVGGVTAGMPQILEDLERRPPALILKPPAQEGVTPLFDPFRIDEHPELEAWMSRRGYTIVAPPEKLLGYTAWGRR